MKKNKKYWKAYYSAGRSNLLLNSKLDRMRYYLNLKPIVNSINILKENINNIDKKILKFSVVILKRLFKIVQS